MLILRRKTGRWIHCIHEKTGEAVSFHIRDVKLIGPESRPEFQVTIAIQDDPRNFRILKPGDRDQAPLESPPPEEADG